jgi:cell division protein FtsN
MASKQRRPSGKRAGQLGGTFLGVVLGLIVGLAIAVVVALYITRSPTPFVARNPNPSGDASAPNSVDPNRALAGANPGQAVSPSAQPAPPNTAPGQPTNPSTGLLDEPQIVEMPASQPAAANPPGTSGTSQAPWPSANNTRPSAGSTPPANTNAPSHSAPATSATPSANDANTGYLLQVGAYRTEADASQQRARLALMGVSSAVSKRESGAVTFYRVRVGPFAKFDDMNSVRQQLTGEGIDTAVIRFTKQ